MDGFVGYMAGTKTVDLAIERRNLDWTQEGEVFTHKIMKIAKGYIRFLHLRLKTTFKYSLALWSL